MRKRIPRGNEGKGRPKGASNKTTRAFKEACLLVFEQRGGVEAFLVWSHANETEFYKICARLIPHEVVGPGADGEHLIKTIQHVHEK
jgi:hypothetical protein